uniref:Uncharacterized protein n=1 Tax=Parascaris equorum TaxID=6256 RepID=A0A914S7P4_PAREQ
FAPLVANATFKLSLTPPASWTYCEPSCGVDDQATDAGSALENAQEDIREAVSPPAPLLITTAIQDSIIAVEAAFKTENVALNGAHRVTVVYEANSTLLEEFFDFFGFDGARYHAENGVIIGETDTSLILRIQLHIL